MDGPRQAFVRLGLASLLALSLLVTAPHPAAAQTAAGALFLNDTVKSGATATGCLGRDPNNPSAPSMLHYGADLSMPTAGKAYLDYNTGVVCRVDFDLVVGLPFTLTGAATLHAFLGCSVPTVGGGGAGGTGVYSYVLSVLVDGTQVGDTMFGPTDPVPCTPGTLVDMTGTTDLTGTSLAAGQVLTVQVQSQFSPSTPPASGSGAIWIETGNPTSVSALTADGIPTAAQVANTVRTYETLTGKSITLDQTWVSPRTAIQTYNWTSNSTSVTTSYVVTSNNGTVGFTIKDGSGAVVQSGSVSGDKNGTQNISPVKAGKWQIVLSYNGFQGHFTMNIRPKGTTSSSGGPTVGTSGDTGGPTSGGSSGSSTSKKSPGIELAPALGLLAVAAILASRRRA
jgi:hypothetical protein